MCVVSAGRLLWLGIDEAIVEVDGRKRRVSTLLVPGLDEGDRVLVGLGMVLERLDMTSAPTPEAAAAPDHHP